MKLVAGDRQLWIATHAIGMLRAARDIDAVNPDRVAFINFEADFDQPMVLTPTKMDRPTWQRALSVALDDLAALMAPRRIVICEGGSAPRFANDGLDGQVYNRLFAASEPDALFFSSGSHTDTERSRAILAALSAAVLPGMEVRRLIDRDDRSDLEVAAERAKGTLVLSRRNLESYLFGDEAIRLLCRSVGKPDSAGEIIVKRTETIANADDFKQIHRRDICDLQAFTWPYESRQ